MYAYLRGWVCYICDENKGLIYAGHTDCLGGTVNLQRLCPLGKEDHLDKIRVAEDVSGLALLLGNQRQEGHPPSYEVLGFCVLNDRARTICGCQSLRCYLGCLCSCRFPGL
jgi:hypothetical protein